MAQVQNINGAKVVVNDMKEKTLFEIPIYSMSEIEFNNRWENIKNKHNSNFYSRNNSKEDTQNAFFNIYYPRNVWEYNQIIGYVKISVTQQDVNFKIYCTSDKRFYADTCVKHFIKDTFTIGSHFYAGSDSDETIKNNIRDWLHSFKSDSYYKRFYFDFTTYNNLIDFINIKEIMKSI